MVKELGHPMNIFLKAYKFEKVVSMRCCFFYRFLGGSN
jgi:hypothetical protein